MLVIFFIIILSVPLYWVVRGKPKSQISLVEGRVLGLPDKTYPTLKIAMDYIRQGKPELAVALVWNLYTSGSLQIKFDGAVTDQFPLRLPIIKFSKSADRQIIKLVYAFTVDEAIPADMISDIYILLNQNALIVPPGILEENNFEIINERLENYHDIASKYPEINFFIYYFESLPYSQYHPLNKYFVNADKGQAFEYFQANLTDEIELGYLPLNGLETHLVNFYRTDHHWNTFGILNAYDGIYEMLSTRYPNIPQKLTPTGMITFPDIEFLGSHARRSLYPVKGDDFIGFDAEFPTCAVIDQGIEGDYDFRDEYIEGNYPTTSYTDHYKNYFGYQTGLLEYQCATQTNRNIVIIGDSYARPLVALIASQYKHTYFIDLRQNPDFSLSSFTSDHPVDDLLVVSDYEVVFLDADQWKIKP